MATSAETKLAILFNEHLSNEPIEKIIARRMMDYKAAAGYAAEIIRNPKNYRYDGFGRVYWEHSIDITDGVAPLGEMAMLGETQYDTMINGLSVLPAVFYVLEAMRNARDEVITESNREMTPAEIEREFNLKPGTVRQYVFHNREWLEKENIIRYPDQRTILMKRGFVLNRRQQGVWVNQG